MEAWYTIVTKLPYYRQQAPNPDGNLNRTKCSTTIPISSKMLNSFSPASCFRPSWSCKGNDKAWQQLLSWSVDVNSWLGWCCGTQYSMATATVRQIGNFSCDWGLRRGHRLDCRMESWRWEEKYKIKVISTFKTCREDWEETQLKGSWQLYYVALPRLLRYFQFVKCKLHDKKFEISPRIKFNFFLI